MWRRLAICAFISGVPLAAAAEDSQLPQPPQGLIELRWSADFAAFISMECAQFELDETADSRLTAFMDQLIEDGVDLLDYETAYADIPTFNGDSTKWLIDRSDFGGVIYPEATPFCDLAEDIYTSDMLTGAMLRRVNPAGNS